jgi:arabinofuranosyltransferase
MLQAPSDSSRSPVPFWVAVAALAVLVVLGALRIEILVDDAFIFFRHASNARDGHGLVWNPPPFQPVEGYTSFSWQLLLWAVWALSDVEPPHFANVLSIGCGVLTLLVCAAASTRLRDREGRPLPVWCRVLALACIVGNRTFLQWQTSGLETGLFVLVVTAWALFGVTVVGRRGASWWFCWSLLSVATAWTRPDGLLFAAATCGCLGVAVVTRRATFRQAWIGSSPMLLILAHLLWRHSFYGEWLPNTYFAKVDAPWPEAGLRYFACFALENAVWLWLPLAGAWLFASLRRPGVVRVAVGDGLPVLAVVVSLAAHATYYVVQVGGDHFEYRVFSHLVPVGVLAALAMAAQLWRSRVVVGATMLAMGAASAIGWYQLWVTEFMVPPSYDPLAPHMPAPLRPIAHWYDRQKTWMQWHMVGIRFLHGMDPEGLARLYPERRRRAAAVDDVPVLRARAVGWVGWVLPDVAVLDELGLNDWVVARLPVTYAGSAMFPKVARDQFVRIADADADGAATRQELVAACAAVTGAAAADAEGFAEAMLLLFGASGAERLTLAQLAGLEPFFANLRLMAHTRVAPQEYVDAFDPNVTIQGRDVAIRPRERPLRAADVQRIEASWRERVRKRS